MQMRCLGRLRGPERSSLPQERVRMLAASLQFAVNKAIDDAFKINRA